MLKLGKKKQMVLVALLLLCGAVIGVGVYALSKTTKTQAQAIGLLNPRLALVSQSCPVDSSSTAPCFSSVQAAINYVETHFPTQDRYIDVYPGQYVETVRLTKGAGSGSTYIIGIDSARTSFGGIGPIRIKAPADGVAAPVVTWTGAGALKNVQIIIGTDPGDVGLRIEGSVLPMLTLDSVSVNGTLPPNGRGIENVRTGGFVMYYDVNPMFDCTNTNANSAAVYYDVPNVPWTEDLWTGGYLSLYPKNCAAGSAVVQINRSSLGDDIDGIVFKNVYFECKAGASCFRVDSMNTHMQVLNSTFRRPLGQFVNVIGTGSAAEFTIEGVVRQQGSVPSNWGNVIPHGTLQIADKGVPAERCFAGWTYSREDATGTQSPYFICKTGQWRAQ